MHAPDDLLAMHAMGDALPDALARHVASCEQCRAELARWSELVAAGRSTSAADRPGVPPARVWDAIGSELGLSSSGAGASAEPTSADVVPLSGHRRRWSTSWLVAAVAAGVIAGVTVTAASGGLLQDDSPAPVASPAVVANATLAALP